MSTQNAVYLVMENNNQAIIESLKSLLKDNEYMWVKFGFNDGTSKKLKASNIDWEGIEFVESLPDGPKKDRMSETLNKLISNSKEVDVSNSKGAQFELGNIFKENMDEIDEFGKKFTLSDGFTSGDLDILRKNGEIVEVKNKKWRQLQKDLDKQIPKYNNYQIENGISNAPITIRVATTSSPDSHFINRLNNMRSQLVRNDIYVEILDESANFKRLEI